MQGKREMELKRKYGSTGFSLQISVSQMRFVYQKHHTKSNALSNANTTGERIPRI